MINLNWSSHRALLSIAIPMILSNITVPLLALVDTAVVGHLSHSYYLGGVAVGSMIATFIFWMCGFLRMSTTGIASQAYGANDKQQQITTLYQGVIVALVIAVTALVLQLPIKQLGFWLAGGSAEVQEYGKIYFDIRIWSAPAALVNLVLLGWMLGLHNAKGPMFHLIVTNIVNIVLDVVLVFGMDMGVEGVATATVIADYCGMLFGFWMVSKTAKQHDLPLNRSTVGLSRDTSRFKRFLSVNRDILLRTLMLQICFSFMTFHGARLGDDIVAANALLLNFLLLISFGLDGIAYAAEAMVGKAKGQQSIKALQEAVRQTLGWSIVFAVIYSLVFLLGGNLIVNLLSDIPAIRETAKTYMHWIVILPLASVWCYLFDGVFIGLTRATDMRNGMFVSALVGFFGVWYLVKSLENHGLWIALVSFMCFRGGILALRYVQLVKQNKILAESL